MRSAWPMSFAGLAAPLSPSRQRAGHRLQQIEITADKIAPNLYIITRTDLVPYRDMILAAGGKVQQMIARGKTLQEVLAAKLTAPYDAKVPGGLLPAGAGTSADRFVSEAYQELRNGRLP